MRRHLLLGFVSAMLLGPALAGAQIAEAPVRYEDDFLGPAFHQGRRAAVANALPPDGVALFFAAPTRTRSNDVDYQYRQSSDLLYLTGSEEPGTVLLLAPGGVTVDGTTVNEVLFVPPRDPASEVWDGRRYGAERAMEQLGVQLAVETDRFAGVVPPLLRDSGRPVFLLQPFEAMESDGHLAPSLSATGLALRARGGEVDTSLLRRTLNRLRMEKTPEEMVLLQRAIDITAEAHRQVMAQVEAGWAEYEIEALLEYVFKRSGSEAPGFQSIVGSGENSVILHYEANRRTTRPGDVVVIDIGAEYHGYSADITRTIPVSGVFSPEQRAIYEIVLEAQQAGIEATRVGNMFYAPHQVASQVLARGLAELGLIRSPTDQNGLGRFFMHGTSHYLGLDVHDVGTNGQLTPGTVITVEPGIYIAPAEDIDPRWWNIGIRIEDDVLVTDAGPRVLSAEAPRTVEEIEALMR